MDLGNIIPSLKSLADIYTQVKGAGRTTTQPTPAGFFPSLPFEIEPDIPFIDIVKKPKHHHHRRKRLATVSDIKDLAALSAVLGKGEAFKTWIATHAS